MQSWKCERQWLCRISGTRLRSWSSTKWKTKIDRCGWKDLGINGRGAHLQDLQIINSLVENLSQKVLFRPFQAKEITKVTTDLRGREISTLLKIYLENCRMSKFKEKLFRRKTCQKSHSKVVRGSFSTTPRVTLLIHRWDRILRWTLEQFKLENLIWYRPAILWMREIPL